MYNNLKRIFAAQPLLGGRGKSGQKTGGFGPLKGGFLMSEEYGSEFPTTIVLEDEEGNEFELEYLDSFEYNDGEYLVFLPTDIDEKDENYGLIILKSLEENGEEILATIDDEAELDAVYTRYMQILFEEQDEEEPVEEEDE